MKRKARMEVWYQEEIHLKQFKATEKKDWIKQYVNKYAKFCGSLTCVNIKLNVFLLNVYYPWVHVYFAWSIDILKAVQDLT